MNKLIASALMAAAVLAAQTVAAHDPKEHENAGPDCAQMKNLDMAKMDMNDPVMKAMHDKCMGQMGHEGTEQPSAGSKAPAKTDEHKH